MLPGMNRVKKPNQATAKMSKRLSLDKWFWFYPLELIVRGNVVSVHCVGDVSSRTEHPGIYSLDKEESIDCLYWREEVLH